MTKLYVKHLIVGVALAGSAWGALALKPVKKINAEQDQFTLEAMVPAAFAEWKIDQTVIPIKPDAETQSKLAKIYDQTLSRTYINAKGDRVMLSIAYGGDQSSNLQVHKPETCYTAQGFEVVKNIGGQLLTQYGQLPIKRLVAVQGPRNEPITYWITVGDKAVKTGIEQRMQKLAYGLTGKVPDGMLVRVSSIELDAENAYKLQDGFVNDMLKAVDNKSRVRLVGVFGA